MNRAQVTLTLIFFAGLMALPVVGCSRQPEGERCDVDNADDDCEDSDNLVCTDATKLRGGDDQVSRCCPEDLNEFSDSRCAPDQGGTDNVGGAGGDGSDDGGASGGGDGSGSGGADNTAGLKDIGEDCNYTSDCLIDLVCGPYGQCQAECKEDRDCDDDEKCDSNDVCVAK